MQPSRHPVGFYVLAFVEFWERLSFYLMKALCALYMVERLGFSAGQASEWMGWYVGAVYALPLPGGLLADRKLGPLRAAILGAIVMMAGHVMMRVESRGGLALAMLLIAGGSGLFKPSMQTMVRGLYKDGDPRIDSAYSQFYLAINLGALLSPVIGFWLRSRYGWGVAFESAAAGLALGSTALILLQRHIVDQRSALSGITGVPLQPDDASRHLPQDPPDTARRVAAVVAVMLIGSTYWAVANMDSGVLTLWIRDCVAGAEKKAELYAGVNPACILLLTPLVVWALAAAGRRRKKPVSTLAKLLLGLAATTISCALLAYCSRCVGAKVDWRWPIAYYAANTVGELFVSPISTALTAKIAPPRLCAFLLGLSLLSSSIGGVVAGQLARRWTSMPHSAFFLLAGLLPVAGAAAVILLWKPLSKLIGESAAPKGAGAGPAQKPIPVLQLVPKMRKAA